MIATGVGVGVSMQGLSINPAIPILKDGNTVGWYEARDLTTVTKDGSNHVTRWNDKLGSGRDFTIVGGTPHWSSTGILFDGVGDILTTDAFTLAQPTQIYIRCRQVTWTNNDVILDGKNIVTGVIYQQTSTPSIKLYAGAALSGAINELTIGSWGTIIVLFSGADSYGQINLNTAITGNFGTGAMGGLSLGGRAGGSYYSNIEVAGLAVRKKADSLTDKTKIMNYLNSL